MADGEGQVAEYHARLRQLFDELDKDSSGHLTHLDVRLLGYVITGQLHSHADVLQEIARVKRECHAAIDEDAEQPQQQRWHGHLQHQHQDDEDGDGDDDASTRLSWNEFLIFSSKRLMVLPLDQFAQLMHTYIVRLRRADPKLSVSSMQRAHSLHASRHKFC